MCTPYTSFKVHKKVGAAKLAMNQRATLALRSQAFPKSVILKKKLVHVGEGVAEVAATRPFPKDRETWLGSTQERRSLNTNYYIKGFVREAFASLYEFDFGRNIYLHPLASIHKKIVSSTSAADREYKILLHKNESSLGVKGKTKWVKLDVA